MIAWRRGEKREDRQAQVKQRGVRSLMAASEITRLANASAAQRTNCCARLTLGRGSARLRERPNPR
jgi:hypothetical protein